MIINLIILLGIWAYSIKNYSKLPQRIPIHFNFEGEADNFAGKKFFFLLPIVSIIICILFSFIFYHPENNNYPVDITKENALFQFYLGSIFSQIILGICLSLFLVIQIYTVKYIAQQKPSLVGLAICIVLLFITIVAYFIISNIYK